MLSPDGLEGTEATWGFDVTNQTDANEWGRLNDGDGLDDLAGATFGSGTLDLTDNVGHTGLVAEESGQMDRLLGVVLGEGLHLTAMTLCPLLGVESHGAMARRRKLTVRLKIRGTVRTCAWSEKR